MRTRALLGLASAAAVLATAAPAYASSHREAPLIKDDPTADLTDIYAWVDQHNPKMVDFTMSVVPFEEPGEAPNYYTFGTNVSYDLNLVPNGRFGREITYRFKFRTHYRTQDTFLYNLGAVTSLRSRNLNVRQTYTVRRITTNRHGDVTRSSVVARNLPVVPNNVGPRSMPNFGSLVRQGVKSVRGGGSVWAGQTDDPFFLDLAAIGDLVHIRPPGQAEDTTSGYNVQSIALQLPKKALRVNGRHPTVGIYASTLRRNINVLTGGGIGPWKQVERLGNPLVNEVLINLDDKDHWNHVDPSRDRQFDHYFLNPAIAGFVGGPTHHRTDILSVFQTGVPKLNKTAGPHADLLRLNTSIPPSAHPNRLGVLGGDLAGYPNGRRLTDDVVDIELKALAGALLGTDTSGVTDNVSQNDVSFLGSFPYLALAHSGFQNSLHHPVPNGGAPLP